MSFVPFSDEKLQELEAVYRRIARVRGAIPPPSPWAKSGAHPPEPPWEVIFRAPTTGESDAFEGKAHDDRAKPGALRAHAKATAVAISYQGVQTVSLERGSKEEKAVREAWDKLRVDYGGVHIAAQGDLQQLMGSVREEQGKD